jgi:hypothetical protein
LFKNSVMKKLLAVLLLGIIASCSNAQYRIQKAQAFFTMVMPGMQMKDDNGNPINPDPIIERFIYIECKFNGKPKVDSVLYNGVLLIPAVADKEETITKIGTTKANGELINMIAKKGNHIWRINLYQNNGSALKHETLNKIIIKGKLAKIKFSYALSTEIELTTPDRY